MPALSAADLTRVRSRPIGRNWRLYVYQPYPLWQGRVAGAPLQGDRELTVTTDIGALGDLVSGMTILCTDSAYNPKLWPSRVRFKSFVGNVITVAVNDIDWALGDRLTGVRLFEIWPRYLRIAGETQFKDYDIAYTDDDAAQPPKANAGPAAIATLVGGAADIVFKDTGSFSCPGGGGISSYQWAALGGAPAVVGGAANSSTVTYRYTTAGYYYVSLTVTDANGETGVVYVPVIIDDGTYSRSYAVPGDRGWDKIGWTLTRRTISLNSLNENAWWYDGAPCFLVADEPQVALNAFAGNRARLRWSGWLTEDTTQREFYNREVGYRAVSSAHIMQNIPSFPVGYRSDLNDCYGVEWCYASQLSIDSIAYLLMNWHSTVMQVCDYRPIGEWTSRLEVGENCEADDLYSQVKAVLDRCYAELRCDRQGILRAVRNEWFLSAAEEAARDTVMTLQVSDISHAQFGPDRHRVQVRETRMDGVDGAGNPYISGAPAQGPLHGGRKVEGRRKAPKSQAELNQWTGQLLGVENHKATVILRMAGEFDCVDPAFGEYVAGTLGYFDTRIDNGPYSVVGVRFTDDHLLGYTLGEWTLMPRPGQHSATAIEIPAETPPPPPPPPPPCEDCDPPPRAKGEVVVVGTVGAGVCITFDVLTGVPPTWYEMNDVIDGSVFSTLNTDIIEDLVMDPDAPSYQLACIDGDGDVFVNYHWRDPWPIGYWEHALYAADCATAMGMASATIMQLAAGSYSQGSLLGALVEGRTGGNYDTAVFLSTDWGLSWTLVPLPFCNTYVHGDDECQYGTPPTYIGSNCWNFFNKSNPNPGGQFYVFESEGQAGIYVAAKCVCEHGGPTAGRSNQCIILPALAEHGDKIAYTHPDSPGAADCPIGNGALGGRRHTDSGEGYNGPLASCYNEDDNAIYMASFCQHEDNDPNQYRSLARNIGFSDFNFQPAYIDVDLPFGWGAYPGMMCAPPVGSGLQFYGLWYTTDPWGIELTWIYQDNATIPMEDWAAPRGAWRTCYCHRWLDELGIGVMYLGRSWNTGNSEEATSQDPRVFYVSHRTPNILGKYWDDKTGNLFALGAIGITAIRSDFDSD